jgi:hypothetical protein
MPKKKPPPPETEPQSERFRKAVRELEADGGLSATEAEAALDRLVAEASRRQS